VGDAGAEPSQAPPDMRATAEKLYQDAYRLAQKGELARACEMYAESDRLDPANGTKLELARCYEKTNRPASAWALYVIVADADQVSGKNKARETAARARASALDGVLPKIVVKVPLSAAGVPGLEITRDGMPLSKALWETPLPVDLGAHRIRASAQGFIPWEGEATVTKMAETAVVTIPALERAPATNTIVKSPVTRGEAEANKGGSGPPVLALVLGGAGLAGLAAGGACGGAAFAKWADVKELAAQQCSDPKGFSGCTQTVADKGAEASRLATASTVGFVAGGAALAGATVAWIALSSDKRGRTARIDVLPLAGPAGGAFVVRGAF
jgi:hypothetical protein